MQSRGFPGDQAASIEKKPGSAATECPGQNLVPYQGPHNTFIVTDSQAAVQKLSTSYQTNQTQNVDSFSALPGDYRSYGGVEKPPLLIGGSHMTESSILEQNRGFCPFGCAGLKQVDFHWLTVSTGPKISKYLLENTGFQEEMGRRPGFNFSERRLCWGGHADRHYGAKQREKKFGFGLDYESWVFSGDTSRKYVELLLAQEAKSKPTRLDIAFDFETTDDNYPRDIVDSVRSYVKNKRFGINAGGDEITGTRYVGSREKDRFLRIYRKDIENQSYGKINGPVMRVELELKGKVLRALWKVLEVKGYDQAFRLAAAHVKDMTSMILLPGELPEIPRAEDDNSDLMQKIFYLVENYGPYIHILKTSGVDLDVFFESKYDNRSRWSKRRMDSIQSELESIDVQELNQRIYDSIMSHNNYRGQEVQKEGAADERFSKV